MPTIVPIKELKNTSTISDLCHSTNEPIFITKNGYGDMVLMSMETYEEHFFRQKMYRELEISEQQIAEGKVMDAMESTKKLREKYGL
ncbi:MAG: type II toxin-antitoxin system Phd/YefM family antitoxin [Phascolarctobacterium sp.]